MSEALVEHLRDLTRGLGAYSARRMFGGWGLYLDGMIFAILADERVWLKADAQSAPAFAAAGGAAFQPFPDKPMTMSYWSIPDEALEDPDAFRPWARLAVEAARRKPAKSREQAKRT